MLVSGKPVRTADVDRADRARYCITDAEVTELAKQAMIPVLVSIYRKRMDYPDIKPDESAN